MPTEVSVADIWPQPFLIRAARGLVGIDQATLAKYAKVSRKAIVSLENDVSAMMDVRRVAVLEAAAEALEQRYGVEFTKPAGGRGEGVRLSRPRRSPG
jgi:DNA-binding XRE family transcriptional regulator